MPGIEISAWWTKLQFLSVFIDDVSEIGLSMTVSRTSHAFLRTWEIYVFERIIHVLSGEDTDEKSILV